MKKQKGFTLIELLIVVAIIGIIAAIAIPNLLDAIERSRQKRSIGDIRNLAGAIQTFGVDMGGYPGPSAATAADPTINTLASTVFTPDYIQAIPGRDGWQGIYTYMTGASNVDRGAGRVPQVVATNFALYSFGSNGATGSPAAPATINPEGVGIVAAVTQAALDGTGPVATPLTGCYQSDICWVNSNFIQVPDGKQKKCG